MKLFPRIWSQLEDRPHVKRSLEAHTASPIHLGHGHAVFNYQLNLLHTLHLLIVRHATSSAEHGPCH